MTAVHPLDDAQVDACIAAAIDDPETATESALFTIERKDQANKAVWRLGRILADLAEDERLYEAERERLDEWIEHRRRRAYRARDVVEAVCQVWHRSRLVEDPKALTIPLPAGELVARKAPDKVNVLDEKAFLASQPQGSPLVREKREPAKRELLAHIKTTGEALPGVEFVTGERRFSARPRGFA